MNAEVVYWRLHHHFLVLETINQKPCDELIGLLEWYELAMTDKTPANFPSDKAMSEWKQNVLKFMEKHIQTDDERRWYESKESVDTTHDFPFTNRQEFILQYLKLADTISRKSLAVMCWDLSQDGYAIGFERGSIKRDISP